MSILNSYKPTPRRRRRIHKPVGPDMTNPVPIGTPKRAGLVSQSKPYSKNSKVRRFLPVVMGGTEFLIQTAQQGKKPQRERGHEDRLPSIHGDPIVLVPDANGCVPKSFICNGSGVSPGFFGVVTRGVWTALHRGHRPSKPVVSQSHSIVHLLQSRNTRTRGYALPHDLPDVDMIAEAIRGQGFTVMVWAPDDAK